MLDYEEAGKIGRPVKNTLETVVVGFGLSLFQILDLEEKSQILTINVWSKYVGCLVDVTIIFYSEPSFE
ncbi:unnamed protein product [Protopolystoma xenopodis]|uniref:Neurotransmitter-gated ion-channel ligand-binding domain-containing protein n=1 Tax=Protopolystoma xenopodis TaxID=117903 RepID=A0A448X748_9PLAT|nr:unnamed protein product [Protopolystoma xenopodis]